MNILVCSLYINPWYREIVKYGKLTLEKYCEKHNYDFYSETEETPNCVYDGERGVPWYKIKLLLKLLEDHRYEYIVWIDADTQIVNPEIKLESFISEMGSNDIFVSSEQLGGSFLNTGFMFVKNSAYSKTLLNQIWNNQHPFDSNFHEQASLCDIYTRNELDSRDHVMIIPRERQSSFSAYWFSYYPGRCFVMHAARCSEDKLGFIFTMDMFCMMKMEEETDEQFLDRQDWLNNETRCRQDIDSYLDGGVRRNLSARYISAVTA
jgi:hypothetical protein